MAFVTVPKDLSKVKTKVALNLTKRQLVCFGAAAVIGIPFYIFTREAIGNSAGALLMIAVMFPFFFLGIYEKDCVGHLKNQPNLGNLTIQNPPWLFVMQLINNEKSALIRIQWPIFNLENMA